MTASLFMEFLALAASTGSNIYQTLLCLQHCCRDEKDTQLAPRKLTAMHQGRHSRIRVMRRVFSGLWEKLLLGKLRGSLCPSVIVCVIMLTMNIYCHHSERQASVEEFT